MTLTQNGIDYICQNFGDESECCVLTGLSWFYTLDAVDYPETGGTAQIVSRLASGLIDSLTMTNPARGAFTQAQLNAANGGTVTIQDAQSITAHDEVSEGQWCYGTTPPPPPFNPLLILIPVAIAIIGVAGYTLSKRKKS